MKYELHYDSDFGPFTFVVESSFDDILGYEFEKAFGEGYSTLRSGLYSDEQKDLVKTLTAKWDSNDIHDYDYYTTRNPEFIDWLMETYEEEALSAAKSTMKYDDPNDWWDTLDFWKKWDIMDMFMEDSDEE